MTIDERIDGLIPKVMRIVGMSGGVGLSELLRGALLEVARDQRHACASAVAEVPKCAVSQSQHAAWKGEAYQAVMSAKLEAK